MSASQLEVRRTLGAGSRPGPAPEKFFETLTAYQHTATLRAAIELDLFTAIGKGHALFTCKSMSQQRADPLLVFEV
jgi:hypothetical protein